MSQTSSEKTTHKNFCKSKVKGVLRQNFFNKMKILGTPKICWADQVKFKFLGYFNGQNGHSSKSHLNVSAFLVASGAKEKSPLELSHSIENPRRR